MKADIGVRSPLLQICCVVGLLCAAILGCKMFSGTLSETSSGEKYPAFYEKRAELSAVSPKVVTGLPALGTNGAALGVLNGKIAIVRKVPADVQPQLDRFSGGGEFHSSPDDGLLPAEIYAHDLAELDTLIKIDCSKSNELGSYKDMSNGSQTYRKFDTQECHVGIIDYKNNASQYEGTFRTGGAPEFTSASGDAGSATFPQKEIKNYLVSFASTLKPPVNASPSGDSVQAADLAGRFRKSPQSVSEYEGKMITVKGYSSILLGVMDHTPMFSVSIGAKDNLSKSLPTVICYPRPEDTPAFTRLKKGDYNLTVVGTFKATPSFAILEQCKLVDAQQ